MDTFIKKSAILTLAVTLFVVLTSSTDFLTEQKKFERVRKAITDKQLAIEKRLNELHVEISNFDLLLVAYKDNDELELYVKKKQESVYKKIHTYEVCSRSGQLGPKRKAGDNQAPEGYYFINRLNPTSNFYLSLGLNYPNQSDLKKSNSSSLGGDIFIHGSCVTIGCLPMTDEKIKEIYLYAVYAKNNGQSKIPVYVFPFKMTDQNMSAYNAKYKDNKALLAFWANLKTGYDRFMKDYRELPVSVAANGDYQY